MFYKCKKASLTFNPKYVVMVEMVDRFDPPMIYLHMTPESGHETLSHGFVDSQSAQETYNEISNVLSDFKRFNAPPPD